MSFIIYFITQQIIIISETCTLYCGKDKMASDGHGIVAGKSMQADWLVTWFNYIAITFEQ